MLVEPVGIGVGQRAVEVVGHDRDQLATGQLVRGHGSSSPR
jgi:hypothetical protein